MAVCRDLLPFYIRIRQKGIYEKWHFALLWRKITSLRIRSHVITGNDKVY